MDASALGCPSDEGEGPGSPTTDDCGGGGASHASTGGLASEKMAEDGRVSGTGKCDSQDRMSKSYGDYSGMNVSYGSGGGSLNGSGGSGGAGGGLIYVQTNSMKHYGSIKSTGGNAQDGTDAGGGSGGTIFVSTYYNTGNGTYSIIGGNSSSSSPPGSIGPNSSNIS